MASFLAGEISIHSHQLWLKGSKEDLDLLLDFDEASVLTAGFSKSNTRLIAGLLCFAAGGVDLTPSIQ